jgi:hypothetical protein
MKKTLIAIAILFSIKASAQDLPNYADSLLTIQGSQRMAIYIGRGIQQSFAWNNRLAPATLKNYVGSGMQLDSLYTVTLKAGYIKQMIELLISGDNEAVQADRLSIINNSPAIPGYTSLAGQITALANGNGAQKNTAIFIRDYYLQRLADFAAARQEVIADVIRWANN